VPTPAPAPPVEAVVETAVYAADLAAAEAFYAGVLGPPVVAREAGRHVFLRVGPASVLLVFDPAAPLRGGGLPPHDSSGPGHLALGIRPDTLDVWRRHLVARGVAVVHDQGWPRGGHSVYVRDPAGNSVEWVTPGVWGTPAGW
jgi:catechol 2,3-dioxygenase-like lactoylglutathione lyase family enzyme